MNLDDFKSVGRQQRFANGSILFHEGQPCVGVFYLVSGRVKLSSVSIDGREAILAIASTGELLGEFAAIDGQPHSATARAVGNVEVVTMRASAFNELIETVPHVAAALLRTITQRLRNSDRKLIEFSRHDTFRRVIDRLLELADRFGEPQGTEVVVPMPLSQDELASWCGSSREAVVKSLRELRSRGLIETARKQVRILDIEKLRDATS